MSATPEGVPEDYEYLPPGEDPPDDHDVVESDAGGTYISPQPTDSPDDDDDAGGSDLPGDPPEDMTVDEAIDYIFLNSGPLDDDEWRNEEDAAVAMVREGHADPDVAAEALIAHSEDDLDGDSLDVLGQNMAGRVANSITGPTEYGVNLPYKTSGIDFAQGSAVDDFDEEYDFNTVEIVRDAVDEWQLGMFAQETAPVFQLAAEQKDNQTLPEGGAFGDEEYIDSVLEIPVSWDEKDAILAKQEQTQDLLREAFGDEITVFRGVSTSDTNPTKADASDAPARIKEAAKNGDTVEHEHRPAESWTTDPGYAAFYSNPNNDRAGEHDDDGAMLRTTVPVEDVVMSAHTTEMDPRESEVVLAHEETVEYEPDDVIPDDELTNKRLVSEALRLAENVGRGTDGVESEAETGETVRVDADEVDPEWLHRDVDGQDEYDPDVETEGVPLSELSVTEGELRAIVSRSDNWRYEEGPRGGDRWVNDDGDVVYSKPADAEPAPDDDEELDDTADDLAGLIDGVSEVEDRVYEFDDSVGSRTIAQMTEVGDTVTIDTSEDRHTVGDTIEAPVNFVDSDWIEVTWAGQDRTFGTENVERLEKDDGELDGGTPEDELAELSTGERLRDAFDHAANREGYREAGGQGGNTTGDEMEILEYQDGSRDFAIPVDAYERATTGVVDSVAEAVHNNETAPIIINELGGSAAQTEIVEDDDGREYIVKEGIDGETMSSFSMGDADAAVTDQIDEDEFKESAAKTMAAAYFTGNGDLHGGNMMVDPEENELSIIDFDSGGYDRYTDVLDIDRYTTPRGVQLDYQEVRENAYEMALDIRRGDGPQNLFGEMGGYMEDAADKATRAAYLDPDFELDDNEVPAELQFPPTGYEDLSDFPDPNDVPADFVDVEVVNDDGDVEDAKLEDVVEDPDTGELQARVAYGSYGFTMITDPNRFTEIDD